MELCNEQPAAGGGCAASWTEPLRFPGRRWRGQPALRFALAYGFRNIQTLLRKVKQGACQYDYVEVMACPSGCVNGGGQLRPGNGKAAQQLIAEVDAAYHHPGGTLAPPGAYEPALKMCSFCCCGVRQLYHLHDSIAL